MNSFNVNLATQYIKALVDFCRCVNCDEVDAKRLRFNCGHSICEKCVRINDTCMLCSPPHNTTPTIDKPQSKRIRHTLELLKCFQDLFNVDVYRQLRISEQLKVEKELFPDCIQAPLKYFNKRKSSIINKENIKPLLLPGENISLTINNTMENSINHVQQWLDKNKYSAKPKKIPRTPFADLEVNNPNKGNILSAKLTSNKRSIGRNDDLTWKSKRLKKKMSTSLKERVEKCEQHESGIGLDTDTIILDDSQSDIVDKDKLALMAIKNADKSNSTFIDNNILLSETVNKEKPKVCCHSTSLHKVPFYKKSYLMEKCKLCVNELINNNTKTNHNSMKNVTLTIDNKSFVTTIKLSEITPNENVIKKSIAIQSDDIEICSDVKKSELDLPNEAINDKYENENLIKDDCANPDNIETKGINKSKCIIIEDSDVDSSDDCNGEELQVEAEVHRSSDQIDYILIPLETQEYTNRQRTIVRGKTPASSDSSDKENFDPNKKKRLKYNKKNKNKKVRKT